MRIIRFTHEDERSRIGARLDDGRVIDATGTVPFDEFNEHYDLDGAFLANLHAQIGLAESGKSTLPLYESEDIELLAPISRPGKIIAIGLNYDNHALESKMDLPKWPLVFSKFSSSVIGPGDTVELPDGSEQVDWEAELGVVIGRKTRQVNQEKALDAVLGYTCLNDVSARDFQFADGQWQRGKSCHTFCPIGPEIVTTDEIPDPQDLSIKLMFNGTVVQDANTADMIFDVRRLISHLSSFTVLEPGDIIATGTPPGCGFAMEPPIYLKSGDEMMVCIDKIGDLYNPVH